MDRRTQKTHDALQESFIRLMGQYPWQQINVQRICQDANVSRSTFYTHFSNKNELLDHGFTQLEQMLSMYSPAYIAQSTQSPDRFAFITPLLEHIRHHQQPFLKNNTTVEGFPVAQRFKEMMVRLVINALTHPAQDYPQETLHFIAAGIYATLVHWVKGACILSDNELRLSLNRMIHSVLNPALNYA